METRTKVLLLLWRCWFLRDDYFHSTGKELVSRSALFLQQYVEEINDNNYVSISDMKDKQGLGQLRNASVGKESAGGAKEMLRSGCNLASSGAWCPPRNGLVKLNTDASFLADSAQTCIAAVAHDHRGLMHFAHSKSN